MNDDVEPSSEVGDLPIEDRIAKALSAVSSHIDVAPRSFQPVATNRRHVRNGRGPLGWAAAIALLVGMAGTLVLLNRSTDPSVTTGSDRMDRDSPVEFESPGGGMLDQRFVDHVAPINGDDGVSAERLFASGYDWARAEAVRPCLKREDLSEAESTWALADTDWYTAHRSPAIVQLPPLWTMAEVGLDSPHREETTSEKVRVAMGRCNERDRSDAGQWQRDIAPLQEAFAGSVTKAIAEVEAGPLWVAARQCLSAAQAPVKENVGEYVQWVIDAPEVKNSRGEKKAGPEAEAFVRCTTEFYEEVERLLEGPRDLFVETHRETLLRLQDEFASFA